MPDQSVLIGGHEFKAIQVINLTKDADIPEHRVEDQFNVADHITLNPVELKFELQLSVPDGEVETLDALYTARQLVDVTSRLGHYTDMAVKQPTYRDSDSDNIVYATLTLKQVRKATAKTVRVALPVPIDTGAEPPKPGSWYTPPEKPVASEPKKEGSWLDGIVNWVGGLVGGLFGGGK